jgi:hypothetical protein
LAQLTHVPSQEDAGEGGSGITTAESLEQQNLSVDTSEGQQAPPPPEYTSPEGSRRSSENDEDPSFIRSRATSQPPIPTYDAAVGNDRPADLQSDTHEQWWNFDARLAPEMDRMYWCVSRYWQRSSHGVFDGKKAWAAMKVYKRIYWWYCQYL